MAHVGLTPQAVNVIGGYRVQGRGNDSGRIRNDAVSVAEAGAFSVVLEKVPDALAREITRSVEIPTIGIGASADCDGQVLVVDDMLGLFTAFRPKFVKRYAELGLEAEGVDVLFAPGPEEVYPEGFATRVTVFGVSEPLEGAFRPGHFEGVATVVTKLLGMTQAGRAFFGEKDWQQLQVVRRLVADLNIPTRVIGCPTIRDPDGLAMSSRNARLSAPELAVAPALHRAMAAAAAAVRSGAPVAEALAEARRAVLAAGFAEVEYLELRGAEGLEPLVTLDRPARILAAAVLGAVRLIDNIAV